MDGLGVVDGGNVAVFLKSAGHEFDIEIANWMS